MAHHFFETYVYTNVHRCNENAKNYFMDFFFFFFSFLFFWSNQKQFIVVQFKLLVNFRYTKVVLVEMNIESYI